MADEKAIPSRFYRISEALYSWPNVVSWHKSAIDKCFLLKVFDIDYNACILKKPSPS